MPKSEQTSTQGLVRCFVSLEVFYHGPDEEYEPCRRDFLFAAGGEENRWLEIRFTGDLTET